MIAQDGGKKIFDSSILHEVKIQFNQVDYWEQLTNNYKDNLEYEDDIPYIIASIEIDGEKLDSIGIRFKGFTSFQDSTDKKPFKIDFNEYNPDKRFDGLRKLNLNPGFADPSMQRNFISSAILNNFGIAAARVSFAKVYINNIYWGLYNCLEQIDKEFLKDNFKDNDGNLFKNSGFSFLDWKGAFPEAYQPPFELKTNETEDNWEGFINFLDLLNNSDEGQFASNIENVFDIDQYIKTFAVDVALSNWDSYVLHGRNYYLYEDSTDHKFSWIPWDYNLALGGGGFSIVGAACNINIDFVGFTNQSNKVEFKDLSSYYTDVIHNWDFGDGNISNLINPNHEYAEAGIYNVCLEIVVNDNCKDLKCKEINTSYFVGDCNSLINNQTDYPANFITQRVIESRSTCCDFWTTLCDVEYGNFEQKYAEFVPITLPVDQQYNQAILIKRIFETPSYKEAYFKYMCDLLNNIFIENQIFRIIEDNVSLINEAVEQDGNFLYTMNQYYNSIGSVENPSSLKHYIKERIEVLKEETNALYNCPEPSGDIEYGELVINEFMASNDSLSGIKDSNGQADDWIELYNNSNNDIDLSQKYLSDNENNKTKWTFPEGTILEKDQYLIVWADEDQDQDGLHTNFKLSKSGESLYLTNQDGSLIDSMVYAEQMTNVSFARIPNGTGDFIFHEPTFGFNNEESSSIIGLSNQLTVMIYPNPTSNFLFAKIQNSDSDFYTSNIFSITGQSLLKSIHKSKHFQIDVQNLNPGFYIAQIKDDKQKKYISSFIISHH